MRVYALFSFCSPNCSPMKRACAQVQMCELINMAGIMLARVWVWPAFLACTGLAAQVWLAGLACMQESACVYGLYRLRCCPQGMCTSQTVAPKRVHVCMNVYRLRCCPQGMCTGKIVARKRVHVCMKVYRLRCCPQGMCTGKIVACKRVHVCMNVYRLRCCPQGMCTSKIVAWVCIVSSVVTLRRN